jgi:hypothetical protein
VEGCVPLVPRNYGVGWGGVGWAWLCHATLRLRRRPNLWVWGVFCTRSGGSLRGESSSNSLSGWGVRRGEAATYTPPVHEVRWFVAHCNEQYVRTPPERLLFFCCYAAKKHPTPNCFGGCHLHNPGCKQSLFERYWGDTSQNAGAGVGGGHGRHPSHLQ